MKKIIEGKRNLLISIVLYCLSISIFLISQLSIVSGTFMSGSVFSYNYPLRVPAMEQAMSKQYKSQIRRRWELPADYWMLLERCCGLRTVWSNDTYEALELWGLDTLVKGQEG